MRIAFKRLPRKTESDMLKKFSLYLHSGLPLSDTIQLVVDQTDNKKIKVLLERWRSGVENGRSLSHLMLEGDLQVTSASIQSAYLGEKAGALADNLLRAHAQLERQINLRKKIVAAVAYPSLIMGGTCLLALGLILFVFPKIVPVFESLKVTLPLSTRLLILVSTFVSKYWAAIFSSYVVAFVSTALAFRRWEKFRRFAQFVMLRLPAIGTIVRTKILYELFDQLQLLLSGGEQFAAGLHELSLATKNFEYSKILESASSEVSQGKSAAEFFRNYKKLFPVSVFGILSVGERTARIEQSVKDIADVLQQELEDRLKIVTAALEPALMVAMSLIIGFIAVSVILPIYGITSHFQNV